MPKHESKSKHKGKSKHADLLSRPEKLVSKLLKWSRKGRAKKLGALLKSSGQGGRALATLKDAHGMTLLHQACMFGHEDTVRILLRYGADSEARDARGNTPAHTAAAAGQLVVLQELLTCDRPPDISLRNDQGKSIEDLVELRLERDRNQGAPSIAAGPGGSVMSDGGGVRQAKSESESEGDSDHAWSRRLAEEASDGEGGHATGWYGPEQGGAMDGDDDEDEAWADRLWQEMQDRRRRAARNTARSFASSFAEAQAADEARKAERHQQVLEQLAAAQKLLREEQEKDRQWRQRAAGGSLPQAVSVGPLDPASARKTYDQRWAAVELHAAGAAAGERMRLTDVPWPLPEGHPYTVDSLRDVLLGDAKGPADIKRRLRAELMRWHPDKFSARFGQLLHVSDQAAVLARVKEMSQCLTAMMVT